ncbi:MAG: hypothetical protein OXE57_04190, partial [Alphaproteobacteria bacterium]|nr:hypothetical protein [Alphaproteobacteria bacterium]
MSRVIVETICIGGADYPIHDAAPPETWVRAANEKGYRIVARVIDRYHVALECRICRELNLARAFVLRKCRPVCKGCQFNERQEKAQSAGLAYLGRDPDDPHYGRYRVTECGHEVRRQFELVQRVADGTTGLRCEICHRAREEEEARARGWRLVGPDPDGDPNYRIYAHEDGCGETQRIARANMQTGRFPGMSTNSAVTGALLGADWTRERSTLGLILGHARGEGGYRGADSGEVSSTLTGFYPYGRYMLSDRVTVWGAAGYGAGTLTLTPEGPEGESRAAMRTNMDLMMAAAGLRGVAVEA